MLTLTDAFAMLGVALAVYAAGVQLLVRRTATFTPSIAQVLGSALVLTVLLFPSRGGLSITAYVRGFSSDLSITLVVLAALSLLSKFGYSKPIYDRELTALMVSVAAAALVLYPTALGWGNWDPYRMGWGSWGFLSALLGLCVLFFVRGLRVLPALVALALLAWSFGLMESGNLWDYLMDPWLSAYALVFVFIKFRLFARRRFANRSSF